MKKLGIIIITVSIILIFTGIYDYTVTVTPDEQTFFERFASEGRKKVPIGNITIWGKHGYPIRFILVGLILMIGGIMIFKTERPLTKICPYCAEKIKLNAKLCRYCDKELPKITK